MRLLRIAVLAVAWALLGACGDDKPSDAVIEGPAIDSTVVTSTSPPPPTTPPPTTGAADEAAQIVAVFSQFFDGAVPVDIKVGLVEQGSVLRESLDGAAGNEAYQQMSTVVGTVEPTDDATCTTQHVPPPCARVSHDLLVSDFPMLVDNQAWATKASGVWQVAAVTWCAVIAIGGAGCPADLVGEHPSSNEEPPT